MNKNLVISLKYQKQIWVGILLLLNLQILSAQPANIDWLAEIGGNSFVNANSMFVDNSGNAYVTGFYIGEVSIGKNTFVARGDSDIFLAKYDQNGNIKWFKQAGSNQASPNIASESGKAVAVDKAGNVYVSGIFVSQALFCDTTVFAHGSQDIFLAKYCTDGKLLWVKSMGHHGSNIAQELMIMGDVVYMTGKSSGSFFNEHRKKPLAFLAAFDPDGNLIWYNERESSMMVLNTFLSVSDENIFWGATTLETPLETAEPGNTMPAFVFIEKLTPGGTVKTSGSIKVNPTSTDYTLQFIKGATFLIDRKTGIVRDVSSSLNEHLLLPTTSSFTELDDFEIFANHNKELVRSSVYLSKPQSSIKTTSLDQAFVSNYIAVNQDYSFDLIVEGLVHPLIQYAPGLRIFSTWLSDDRSLYILANYSGQVIIDELDGLLSMNQNTILFKIDISSEISTLYPNLADDLESSIFSLFPNPSVNGVFNLHCNEPQLLIRSIVVKNSRDQFVHADYSGILPSLIDLATQSSGVYVIVIEHEKGIFNRKIVINK